MLDAVKMNARECPAALSQFKQILKHRDHNHTCTGSKRLNDHDDKLSGSKIPIDNLRDLYLLVQSVIDVFWTCEQ